MKVVISVVLLSIVFVSAQAQAGYGYMGYTGPYGPYGPFSTNVNPSLAFIADSFFTRILRRLDHMFIASTQRDQVNDILKDTENSFKQCESDYALLPVQQFKTCLATYTQIAMGRIRTLERMNRPYGYRYDGNRDYVGYGDRFVYANRLGYGERFENGDHLNNRSPIQNSIKSSSSNSDESSE